MKQLSFISRLFLILTAVTTLGVTNSYAATSTTIYYVISASDVGSYTVKLNVNRQGDGDNWATYTMTRTDKTYEGKYIYSCTFTDLYNGLGCIQFQLYNGGNWVSEEQAFGKYTWTGEGTYNGKMWVKGETGWKAYTYDQDYNQQGSNAGWWGTNGIVLDWSKNGCTTNTYIHYSSTWGEGIGTITSSLQLTNTTVKCWRTPGSGNICGSTIWWELYRGSTKIDEGNYSPATFGTWDGNNNTITSNTSIDFYAKTSGTAGNYTIRLWAKLTGSNHSTSDCHDTFWYNNNGGGYYTITFTIPSTTKTVYFVNSEGWASPKCYAWNGGDDNCWPGVAMTSTGSTVCGYTIYRATIPNSFGNCIFSNNGASQTADQTVQAGKYYHPTYDIWYDNTDDINAECVVSTGKPVMTYGKAEIIYNRSADIQVRAVDDNTPFSEILYYCEFETPMGELYTWYQVDFKNSKTGYFELINLIPCSEYTLSVWAIDNDGNFSDNKKVIKFTTVCDDGDGLYLRGDMSSWNSNLEDWRFQWHTYEHDRYILIQNDITEGQEYKYYKSGWDPGSTAQCDSNLYAPHDADIAVFTAKDLHHHISSFDEIYIVGTAINDGSNWDMTTARLLTWDNPICAIWEGPVKKNGKYKIVVRHHIKCGGSDSYYDRWDDVCNGEQTFGEEYTNGILTFDLLTWGWSWKNADDNLCEKTGAPRAGLKPSEFAGTTIFQKGYEVSIYTPSANQLIITAKSNDWFTRTGSAAPIFMLFAEEDVTHKTLEKTMTDTGVDDVNHNRWFTLTINAGDLAQNYGETLVSDFTMGACIRFSIKFPFAGSMSITDPMYYYIRQGCAPYYFNIYHHGDLPGTRSDTIERFQGGEILQPIIYRRLFTPGAWETLCLPFTCSAVRVYDPDDDMEYDLRPQHNSENAEYWLRTFGPATYTERDGFKPNWQNVPVGVELPQKDVPYIMQVPAGDYYRDKYVMFYGKGYQTIANKTPWTKQSSADGFRYFGNTTMWPQNLGQAYMISADGLWFEKSGGNTLYPFECYVVADPTNTAKYVRFGGVGEQAPEVATGCPNVNDDQHLDCRYDGERLYVQSTADTPISIYSIDGHLILSSELQNNIESAYPLVPGIYIVSTKLGIHKLAL